MSSRAGITVQPSVRHFAIIESHSCLKQVLNEKFHTRFRFIFGGTWMLKSRNWNFGLTWIRISRCWNECPSDIYLGTWTSLTERANTCALSIKINNTGVHVGLRRKVYTQSLMQKNCWGVTHAHQQQVGVVASRDLQQTRRQNGTKWFESTALDSLLTDAIRPQL
jgi:hypothetical protein